MTNSMGVKIGYLIIIGLCMGLTTTSGPSNQDTIVNAQNHENKCSQAAQCEPLSIRTCFGSVLPYSMTSVALANDSGSQDEAHLKLSLWSGLASVPRCWEIVQPFLCSVYLPRCNGSEINLPSFEMCEKTREPCKIVETSYGWPNFLKCDHPHFVKDCQQNEEFTKNLRFNTSSQCKAPLVTTDNPDSWYEYIEGCGLPCQNPLFTPAQHQEVQIVIAVLASLCLICTLFTIVTFLIDWKNANRYPALILFFINTSFFVGCIGWLIQFIPGARDDIVCRRDGTVRKNEPQIGSGETPSCSVIFVVVYFSMMAGITWFVILAYAWHLTFRSLGSPRDAIEGKKGHFHVAAWSIPLVLTIVCLTISQVDGDSVSGICFVGYFDHMYRGLLVLAPVGIAIIIGMFFLGQGLVTLIKIKIESPGLISDRASAKIKETIIRLGVFTGLALSFAIISFAVHVYIFINESRWMKAFQDYMLCEKTLVVSQVLTNQTTQCRLESQPSLVAMELHILSFFGSGITMSSWVWNGSTREAWKRFFRKVFRLAQNEPIHLKKHKIIAQAYNRKQEVKTKGGRRHISFSFHSTHDDPLGMRFELNSVTSTEMSSAWAGAIPRMIRRRGAMVHPTAKDGGHGSRRYSDSDVQSIQSFHQTHSRRASMDSRHFSVEESYVSEIEETVKKRKNLKKKRSLNLLKRSKNRVSPATTPVVAFQSSPAGGAANIRGAEFSRHMADKARHNSDNRHAGAESDNQNKDNNNRHGNEHSRHGSENSHHGSEKSFRGLRRGSAISESNISQCSAPRISMDQFISSDNNSISTTNPFMNNLRQYTAVNHMSSYSMVSGFLPPGVVPGAIGLTDIEDPSSCFSIDPEPFSRGATRGHLGGQARGGSGSSSNRQVHYPTPAVVDFDTEELSETDVTQDIAQQK